MLDIISTPVISEFAYVSFMNVSTLVINSAATQLMINSPAIAISRYDYQICFNHTVITRSEPHVRSLSRGWYDRPMRLLSKYRVSLLTVTRVSRRHDSAGSILEFPKITANSAYSHSRSSSEIKLWSNVNENRHVIVYGEIFCGNWLSFHIHRKVHVALE